MKDAPSLTEDIKKYIECSVLCWLATSDKDGIPNVSPKEVFTYSEQNTILIAHIASPQSVKNIIFNPNVCVSFVDILIQKGYKIHGKAQIFKKGEVEYHNKVEALETIATERFPIHAIIEVEVQKVKQILAPSYILYPESTTEDSQRKAAIKRYGL